ncbi:MAG: hypothetical protein ABIZ91_20095, partial [Gemmatimonadaceae bacterium]
MKRLQVVFAATCIVAAFSCHRASGSGIVATHSPDAGERHFTSIRQLTNGGENAEAYFSADGKWLTFQSTREGRTCDQQYVMRVDGTGLTRVSNGLGKTTCGWFLPDGKRLFFASSHAHDSLCPPRPDPSAGYVWGLDRFDIYTVDRDGSDLKRLTNYDVYTAEGVLSPDGKKIVYRAHHPADSTQLAEYRALLARNMIRPSRVELFVMNA